MKLDVVDRCIAAGLAALAFLISVLGLFMTAIGWSDWPSVVGLIWGTGGPIVALGGFGVSVWIAIQAVTGRFL